MAASKSKYKNPKVRDPEQKIKTAYKKPIYLKPDKFVSRFFVRIANIQLSSTDFFKISIFVRIRKSVKKWI